MLRRGLSFAPTATLAFGLLAKALGMVAILSILAACSSLNVFGNRSPEQGAVPPSVAAPPANAEILGTGSVRVALMLPLSASGNSGETAKAFRNAAELAMQDFPGAGIQVAVYDTQGTAAGAQAAVGTALQEQARIILGPVFSNQVSAVAQTARQAGVPVVAFSSDASVAGPGVYLLSFLPSDDVNRIVSYSASRAGNPSRRFCPQTPMGRWPRPRSAAR